MRSLCGHRSHVLYVNIADQRQILQHVIKLCSVCTVLDVPFANSEDPDEMPHFAAFYQDLFCLLKRNQSSKIEIQYFWKL